MIPFYYRCHDIVASIYDLVLKSERRWCDGTRRSDRDSAAFSTRIVSRVSGRHLYIPRFMYLASGFKYPLTLPRVSPLLPL